MKELQAFPVSYNGHEGMTLRDYFAAQVLGAFCADFSPAEAARMAYKCADAMLEARNGSR